ncbi:TPA: hypothetical protein ACH3X2_013612 [Trebouxia sp. C0005]
MTATTSQGLPVDPHAEQEGLMTCTTDGLTGRPGERWLEGSDTIGANNPQRMVGIRRGGVPHGSVASKAKKGGWQPHWQGVRQPPVCSGGDPKMAGKSVALQG